MIQETINFIDKDNFIDLNISGNFQYDAGLFGFIRVLEKFYPDKYHIKNETLTFSKDILDDFSLCWFKMLLLQNNLFNNAVFKEDGKLKQGTKYKDKIDEIINSSEINFSEMLIKVNLDLKDLIKTSKTISDVISKIKNRASQFVNEIINIIDIKLQYLQQNYTNSNDINIGDSLKDLGTRLKKFQKDLKKKPDEIINSEIIKIELEIKRLNELTKLEKDLNEKFKLFENLKIILKKDLEGRFLVIEKGNKIRSQLMPYNFNKGMFNTADKKSLSEMKEKFHKLYIEPIFQLDSSEDGLIKCDFCDFYNVDIGSSDNLLDRTHLLGSVSKITFSNLYWFGNPSIFFCDLCELIMMCTVFGFNDKYVNSDLDNFNKIFIHSPSLQAVKDLNSIAKDKFSFESVLDEHFNRVTKNQHKAEYVLENILFVELLARGQNTKLSTFHINSNVAKFLSKNYKLLQNIKGNIIIKKGKNIVKINLRYEILKKILEGRNDIQDIIEMSVMETINKDSENPTSFKDLAIIQYRLKGGEMVKEKEIIYKFYEQGKIFSKSFDWKKKRPIVYNLMQTIRGNDKDKFMDNLFLLYMSKQIPIPKEIINILGKEDTSEKNRVNFKDVANAFISGILSLESKKSESIVTTDIVDSETSVDEIEVDLIEEETEDDQ